MNKEALALFEPGIEDIGLLIVLRAVSERYAAEIRLPYLIRKIANNSGDPHLFGDFNAKHEFVVGETKTVCRYTEHGHHSVVEFCGTEVYRAEGDRLVKFHPGPWTGLIMDQAIKLGVADVNPNLTWAETFVNMTLELENFSTPQPEQH